MSVLLIIYPHWPPSNLAGVNRARLTANAVSSLGWKTTVLTVKSHFYEEPPDLSLQLTVNPDIKVHQVKAYGVTRPRLVGDIGLRAFTFLYRKALQLIRDEQPDFLWIPIPSFYVALLGRGLHAKTGIPYGIDYIDPWVRDITGRNDWRHRLSNYVARFLEPIAIKHAALITGVSFEYYQPVLKRNFAKRKWIDPNKSIGQSFKRNAIQQTTKSQPPTTNKLQPPTIFHTSFPYGFDLRDHEIVLDNVPAPWESEGSIKPWLYAGAFLPNSRLFVKCMFSALEELRGEKQWDDRIRFYFIGTSQYAGKSITEYAKECGLKDIVKEHRGRYPYLETLNFLSTADTVMVIGSTEMHYTASKVFQALLSKSPVWSVFHEASSAVKVMMECQADQFLVKYQDKMTEDELTGLIKKSFVKRLSMTNWDPDLTELEKYSAKESARKLVSAIEKVLLSKREG